MILIDGKKVEFGKFPNGETHLNFNKLSLHSRSAVVLKYESDQDLFNLTLLKNWIDDELPSFEVHLIITYMPYSRMDRRNQFYCFTLRYVCEAINRLGFSRVEVYDAHSDVTAALLDRYQERSYIPKLLQVFCYDNQGLDNLCVFYPDAGAEKRYSPLLAYPTLVGSKKRSFENGKIEGYEVHGSVKPGSDFVIIDDLCSRGGTFIACAEALYALGAKSVYLIVSHCEPTIFTGDIPTRRGLIMKVYTTDSILNKSEATDKPWLNITTLEELKNA